MKHGAVIVKGGRVLATGINKERNHPMKVSFEHIKTHCSVHAEIDALKKVDNAQGATIYVARVNRRGEDRNSRPCEYCYKDLKESGIKKIIYTS